jgi:hypothetical protein
MQVRPILIAKTSVRTSKQESATEEMLRRRILDEAGLPYVHVKLDPSWDLPGDLHPDPHAAQAIAIAVAERLHGRYADGMPPGWVYRR